MPSEYNKPIKCQDHIGEVICDRQILPIIIKALQNSRFLIQKIMLCDKGGYHIWTKQLDITKTTVAKEELK